MRVPDINPSVKVHIPVTILLLPYRLGPRGTLKLFEFFSPLTERISPAG